MKSRYKILSAMVAGLLIFSSVGASAATTAKLTPPDENGKTIISGTTDTEGEVVTLIVFGDNKSAADLSGNENGTTNVNDPEEIITFGGVEISDANKEYSFEFTMGGGSGRYKAYVGPADSFDGLVAVDVPYRNANEAKTTAAALNAWVAANPAATTSDFIDYCETIGQGRIAKLGFYGDFYDNDLDGDNNSTVKNAVFGLVLDSIKAEALDVNDYTDSVKLFALCAVKYAMDNGVSYSFENEIKDITFKKDSCIDKELGLLKDSDKFTTLETRVKAGTHSNGRDFEDVLTEQLVLTRIENTGGFDDTAALVKNYTGLSTSGINNEEWEELGGVYYASYELLDEALKPYRTDDDGEEGSDDTSSDTDDPSGADNNQTGAFPAGSGGSSGGGPVVKPALDEEVEVPTEEKPLVAGFKDIPTDAWYINEVQTLVDAGYLSGRGDGKFEPEDNITRCEIAKLVTLIASLTTTGETGDFGDVADGHWAYNYIKAAADNGIVSGIGDGAFAPDVNITRQDLAVMISRVIAAKAEENDAEEETKEEEIKLGFKDADEAADYAVSAIAELVELKIINGYEDNTFRPGNYVTRAEAAKLLCGLLEMIG